MRIKNTRRLATGAAATIVTRGSNESFLRKRGDRMVSRHSEGSRCGGANVDEEPVGSAEKLYGGLMVPAPEKMAQEALFQGVTKEPFL